MQLRSATAGNVTGGQPVQKATANDLVFRSLAGPRASPTTRAASCTPATAWTQAPRRTPCCGCRRRPTTRRRARLRLDDGLPRLGLAEPAARRRTTGKPAPVAGGLALHDSDRCRRQRHRHHGPCIRGHQYVHGSPGDRPPEQRHDSQSQPPAGGESSCQALSNGHALCDASASVDPDGETLTYSWAMDGSPLSARSYHLDQSGLASHSTHSFTVTITDRGLTSSATRSSRCHDVAT